MCLITTQSEPEILEEDLIVYKILDIMLRAKHVYFMYSIGKLYKTKIEETDDIKFYDMFARFHVIEIGPMEEDYDRAGLKVVIDKYNLKCYGPGFHSFETIDRDNGINVECTIPKGSEVYRDGSGLLISNQIIINRKISIQQ
jgi:hypothetical protein